MHDQNVVIDVYKPFKEGDSNNKEEVTHYVKEQLECVEVLYRMGNRWAKASGSEPKKLQEDE